MVNLHEALQTRDGQCVRLLHTNGNHRYPLEYPLVGLVGKDQILMCWTRDGSVLVGKGQLPGDLVNPSQERKVLKRWMNVWKGGFTSTHMDKNAAAAYARHANKSGLRMPIACVPVEIGYTKGEGL